MGMVDGGWLMGTGSQKARKPEKSESQKARDEGKWQATSAANYRLPRPTTTTTTAAAAETTTATSQRNDIFKLLLYLHLSQVQNRRGM